MNHVTNTNNIVLAVNKAATIALSSPFNGVNIDGQPCKVVLTRHKDTIVNIVLDDDIVVRVFEIIDNRVVEHFYLKYNVIDFWWDCTSPMPEELMYYILHLPNLICLIEAWTDAKEQMNCLLQNAESLK